MLKYRCSEKFGSNCQTSQAFSMLVGKKRRIDSDLVLCEQGCACLCMCSSVESATYVIYNSVLQFFIKLTSTLSEDHSYLVKGLYFLLMKLLYYRFHKQCNMAAVFSLEMSCVAGMV